MPGTPEHSLNGSSSRYRWWVLGLYWTVMFVSTHWPNIARYRLPNIPWRGLIAHVGVYLIWTVLWWWVLSARGRRVSWQAILLIFIGGLCYAVVDEASQVLVHRSPRPCDLAADMVGILAGLALMLARRQWISYRQANAASSLAPHQLT